MKYLVTGATGFIGSEVVRQLLLAEHHVHAVVRAPSKAKGWNGQKSLHISR